MGLRQKTLVTIGLTLIMMVLLIYSLTSAMLIGDYKNLEKQSIIQNAERAMELIAEELEQVKSVVRDWAPWDDTYLFVQNNNKDYIDNNLMESTFTNLKVNFLVYINMDGEITHCSSINLKNGIQEDCPNSLIGFLAANPSLLRDERHSETLTGIALLAEHPALLAFAPILTSQFKGPIKGTLVAGRYLNPWEVEKLSSKSKIAIKIERMDRTGPKKDFEHAKKNLTSTDTFLVEELPENTIAAYTVLTDFNNVPILMLRVHKEQKLYAQGKKSLVSLVLSMLLIGLVFIFVVMTVLERTVLSRILNLNNEIKHIGATGDLLTRTSISGQDELTDLCSEINNMLESLREKTERDRAILDSIEDAYFEFSLEGDLIFFNHSALKLIEKRIKDFTKINYRQFLDKDALDEVLKAFKHLYKTGEPITALETELVFPNREKYSWNPTSPSSRTLPERKSDFEASQGILRNVKLQKEN